MHNQRKPASGAAVAIVTALALTAGITSAAASPRGEALQQDTDRAGGPAARPAAQQITLVTGDRVRLDGQGRVIGLLRAPGREDVPVRVLETGDGVHVLPLDVVPMLAEGTLDRRLFNVTELSREQYRETGGVPLIVTWEQDADATRAELHRQAGPEVRAELETIDGEALLVDEDGTAGAWEALTEPAADGAGTARAAAGGGDGPATEAAPGVAGISLDGLQQASLDTSTGQIGAPDAWAAGFDGTGTTIAVLDTGIDTGHGDFEGKVVAEANFSESPTTDDLDGHGTHVASIAAGTGARSGGTYRGVAPGAALLNGKVLDDYGFGFDSQIIEGMEWAAAQGADIINMSLGGPAAPETDPLEEAVERITEDSGVLFVIAAGNDGPRSGSVGSPGTADSALTVGAVDGSDEPAAFSSVGPRSRDGALKPDLTAPGVDIGAAAADGSLVAQEGRPVADGYAAISGTSMAAPHAAGAAALLAQRHPEWTGQQIKAALMGSTVGLEGSTAFQAGAGRLDVSRALEQRIIAEPGSLSFGAVPYPHEDDQPVVKDLTYRNLGDSDITLALTAEGTGPEGEPAPEGMFTLSAGQVTVPAGGTATVQVTADTTHGGAVNGGYSLFLTAEGDGHTVRTAGAVEREAEKFDLDIHFTGRDGEPAERAEAMLIDLENFEPRWVVPQDGTASLRLPEGEYLVDGVILAGEADDEAPAGLDWMVTPPFRLTGDTELRYSSADAGEMSPSVFDRRAVLTGLTVDYLVENEHLSLGTAISVGRLPEGMRTAQVGPVSEGWYTGASAAAGFRRPDAPVEYHMFHTQEGGFYTGLRDHLARKEAARITTRAGASVAGKQGEVITYPAFAGYSSGVPYGLPAVREVYVQAGTTAWAQEFVQYGEEAAEVFTYGLIEDFRAGKRYTRTFNTGVFGPAMGDTGDFGGGLFRYDDHLFASIPPLADGAGRYSESPWDSAETVLYRNGEEWARQDVPLDWSEFALTPEEAEYRLVSTISRRESGVHAVSTEVRLEYTFTSAAAAGGGEEDAVRLPASGVRFTPKLALDSTSPGGRKVRVPVTVQGSAAGGNLGSLTVEVSFDRGESWQAVKVRKGRVVITNPPAGGSVSFRATVSDKQGNTAVQTLIDAYRTR
ncbi:S8 family peptidase [Streptomyces aidingensis]|uniref:Subtilase family protein n=1 Tax=Streptomyces aidingensis TaxID=910347 RepID=A0A1I1EK13_9ACTN|nr:S8 family serine peptidase [Streptomyces aidingensis]SFB87445.1 Subtilase family protein [Streptomyces aidingensis]